MNNRDSEWVMGNLLDKGFKKAGSQDQADVIIFNTCSVRKHAEERVISNMGQLAKLKKKNPKLILGLMGCTAEYYGDKLFRRLPHLDIICGTARLHMLPEMIEGAARKAEKQACLGDLKNNLPESDPDYRDDKNHAFVSIGRGCNNYCSYCIVPYVRGPERSRKPDDIINEVNALITRGCENITLLGQNVNSYGKDLESGIEFVELLRRIDKIDGKKKIKFVTSHPKDASVDLFAAMNELSGVSKDLHLPMQSGSDKILESMRRGYDSNYYLKLVRDFRRIVPDGRISTDIIIGFPGETDEDHRATVKIVEDINFDASYIFKYSPRPPAPSTKMKDDVSRAVKEERHLEVLTLQKKLSARKKKVCS